MAHRQKETPKSFTFYIGSRFVFQHNLRSTLHFMFLSDEGPTFETLDFTLHIGNASTILYFNLYLNTAYVAHYVLCFSLTNGIRSKR